MRIVLAILLGTLLCAPCLAAELFHPDSVQVCETVVDGNRTTSTCTIRHEFKSCERNALIAYGLSMPMRERITRSTFSGEDVAKAEPLAREFRNLPEDQRTRALTEARAICMAQ